MTHKRKHKFRKFAGEPVVPAQESVASHEDDRSQMPLLPDEAAGTSDLAARDQEVGVDEAEIVARENLVPGDAADDLPTAQVEARTEFDDAPDNTPAEPASGRDIRFRRDDPGAGEASFGATLRATREQRGWTQTDVGARLKLPIRLIERLEQDDYAGMTQGVYLRGYLTSYARLLDLPVSVAEQVAEERVEAVPLVATGTTSHSRYLFDRYSVSATYLILTALIVAPAVWLATHGGLEQNLARNLPLDGALVALDEPMPGSALAANASVDPGAPRRTIAVDPPPIISSIASFPSLQTAAPAEQETRVPQIRAPEVMPDGHSLTLRLTEESWVEVLDTEGKRVEYGLLPAGIERSYHASGPLSVHLGNADGATILADGKVVDLAPFRRANVVRLTVFDAESGSATPSAH